MGRHLPTPRISARRSSVMHFRKMALAKGIGWEQKFQHKRWCFFRVRKCANDGKRELCAALQPAADTKSTALEESML